MKTLFRLFSRRKARTATTFPLSLKASEWQALQELVASPAWEGFRALLERYAELRAMKLLQPLSPEQTNLERGALAALVEIAALPELLISHWKDIDDARRNRAANDRDAADERHNFYWQWGSSLFADEWRRRTSGTPGRSA